MFKSKALEPRIERKEPFQVIGRTGFLSSAGNLGSEIGAMWSDWGGDAGISEKVHDKYSSDKSGYYMDVDISAPTAEDPTRSSYTIGCKYNGAANEDGYGIVTVPGGKYAIFPIPRKHAKDHGDFRGQALDYLAKAGHELAGAEVGNFGHKWDKNWEIWFMIKE